MREIESVGDDVDPFVGCARRADEVVPDLVADGDDRAGVPGEQALDLDEEPLAAGVEVADAGRGRGRCAPWRRGAPVRSAWAAIRPVVPAFAVCVCRTSGRRRRIVRLSSRTAATSARGDSSRCSAGRWMTGTPRSSATYSIDSSPAASVPATTTTSWPRRRCSGGELDHRERCASDVESGDRVDDREASRRSLVMRSQPRARADRRSRRRRRRGRG